MASVPQNLYEDLLKENEVLKARLDLLKRHKVYGFSTIDGRLFYAGQETEGGRLRIRNHLEDVTKVGKVSVRTIDCLW
jgi:hypothetical protein